MRVPETVMAWPAASVFPPTTNSEAAFAVKREDPMLMMAAV